MLHHLHNSNLLTFPGQEYRAIFLSTPETVLPDGEDFDPTCSLSNPYVFITALTHAQSLVVSVGNPFALLKAERQMVDRYGEKGRCWSEYLKLCLSHNTFVLSDQMQETASLHKQVCTKITQLLMVKE